MKEKFSEEYNLVLQLNHRKKVICENLFSDFRNTQKPFYNILLKKYLEPDVYDFIVPSTFKKLIEDYYDEQTLIADTIHDLTNPSTFMESIEEYYEIQKHIIENTPDFSDISTFNEKNIEENIQKLIEPLSFTDKNFMRELEEERILRSTAKIFSHPFFESVNKVFNNIYLLDGNLKISINENMCLTISRKEFYTIYERIENQTEYSSFEKMEIVSLFCITYSLSNVYYTFSNEATQELQKFIAEFQILSHFYVKNISPEVFFCFKDPKKMDLMMPRHSAPLLFWFLLKFIINNFPKWG